MQRASVSSYFILLVIAGMLGSALALTDSRAQGPSPADVHQNEPKASPAPAQSRSLALFFIGRRRSTIEPCGCQSQQEGGMQYEATLLGRAEADGPTLRVDAGEWTDLRLELSPFHALKNYFLLRGLAMMQYDAINLGVADLQFGSAYFQTYAERYPQATPPFVSANVFKAAAPAEHAWPTHRIVRRKLKDGTEVTIGITGATARTPSGPRTLNQSPSPAMPLATGSFLVRPASECLAPVLAQLRPQVNLLVLLYAGDQASALELARAHPMVDCLVANGRVTEVPDPIRREGKVRLLGVRNVNGKELGMARLTLGAQGQWESEAPAEYLAVNQQTPAKRELLELLAELKQATQALDPELPRPGTQPNLFVGAQRCQACHPQAFKHWQSTRHARALHALVDKGQQFNPECLPCHVTGYRRANGFYTVNLARHNASGQMFHVQCESCHGPAHEHAVTQQRLHGGAEKWMSAEDFQKLVEQSKVSLPIRQVPAAVCLPCHTPEHAGAFDYAKLIGKVKCDGTQVAHQ